MRILLFLAPLTVAACSREVARAQALGDGGMMMNAPFIPDAAKVTVPSMTFDASTRFPSTTSPSLPPGSTPSPPPSLPPGSTGH
jgi:hypothetical protein